MKQLLTVALGLLATGFLQTAAAQKEKKETIEGNGNLVTKEIQWSLLPRLTPAACTS
jgi:hypothetical protein